MAKKPKKLTPEELLIMGRGPDGKLLKGHNTSIVHGKSRVEQLAQFIASKTLDGRIIAEEVLRIGKSAPREADRLRAFEILLERMVGKAIDIHAMVDLTGSAAARPHSELASGLLEHLIRTLPSPATTPNPDTIEGEVVDAAGIQPSTLPDEPESE